MCRSARPVRVQVRVPTFVRSTAPTTDPAAPPTAALALRSADVQVGVFGGGVGAWTVGVTAGVDRRSTPRLASPAEAPTTMSPTATTKVRPLRTTLRRARASIFGGAS